jgi:hypothetical protein
MLISDKNKRAWLLGCLFSFSAMSLHAGNVEHAVETQAATDLAAQKSQETINALDDEATSLMSEYRNVLSQTESLKAYNDQLAALVDSQNEEITSIDKQLSNIETTQRDIVPLMLKMIDVLAQFVELDVPFLAEERQIRVVNLKALMSRADVSLAEKYRRILEAYQVETEYGRTIEAYQAEIELDGNKRTVDFLRIGRTSLYYLTLDGLKAGMWNQQNRSWQSLGTGSIQAINQGLKVALKQSPPDLLVLPVVKQEQK